MIFVALKGVFLAPQNLTLLGEKEEHGISAGFKEVYTYSSMISLFSPVWIALACFRRILD